MVDAAPDRVTRYYQGHVFGPVQPLDRTVPVETLYGQVPINFPDGFYLRNGPNPINVRGNVWYHIFDVSSENLCLMII
jgi:carotenoid cleavage dioxygenase-like enzyme